MKLAYTKLGANINYIQLLVSPKITPYSLSLRTKVGKMHGSAPRIAEGAFPVWDLSVN